MLQKNREFKVLKAGIFSATFFGLMLSASTVFADIVAPTTNSPYMGSGTSIGAYGQTGNQVAPYDSAGHCRGGGGDDGSTGSPSPLNVYQSILAPSGYGTGVYALATGGRGGDGGRNTNSNCNNHNADDGGRGGTAAPVNVWLVPGAASGTTLSSTGIYAVSGGGNGGDGGRNNQGGTGGYGANGGAGGEVYVSNTASIVTGNTDSSYGIFAKSYGGNGGRGGNSSGWSNAGDGGMGGLGGVGGPVEVVNSGSIQSNLAIPIFAQSIGGTGGGGGDSTGGIFTGGDGGGGGNGASAGWILVSNQGTLTSSMVGGFGVHAQSVGGSGGTAGASAGLVALGATGGQAASGGDIKLTNLGAITLSGASSSGLHAQSVGGGGGHGGLATGTVAIGGSGGSGGGGAAVYAMNTGVINTGYNLSNTASTNGGAFGIVAQSVGGGGGIGGMGISNAYSVASFSLAVGGSGGNGGSGSQVVVANSNSIRTTEPNSAAIFAQSIGGGGGSGGGAVSTSRGVFFGFGSGVGGGAGTGGAGGLVGVNCKSSSDSSSNPCYNLPTVSGGDSATGGTLYFTAGSPITGAQISTSGVGSPGILAQSVGGGGGNGGYAIQLAATTPGTGLASLSSAFGGKAGAGGYGSNVYASSAGVNISTTGSDSPGLLANSTGGGGGTGGVIVSGSYSDTYSAALSIGGTGGSGGNGSSVTAENTNNGSVWNASSITTTGARSYGILAQSIGGGGGSGGATISLSGGGVASLALALGGSGAGGGDANVVSLSNDGNITTSGSAASALIAQSIAGGGGNGGFSVSGSAGLAFSGAVSVGGGGGRGGTGMNVTLTNKGSLLTQGGGGAAILAQSIGGGGGNGGFSGAGSLSFSSPVSLSIGGSGAAGGTSKPVTVSNYGSITANNTNAFVNASNSGVVAAGHNPGILAQSIGGSGGFGGFSVGGAVGAVQALGFSIAGSGGVGGGGGDVTVTNSGASSAITTAGPLSSAIIAQSFGGNGGNGGLAAGGAVSSILSLSSSLGGAGGSGGRSGVINISNSGALAVNGVMSSAILAQSIGGSGGNGGVAVAGSLTVNLTTIPVTAAVATSVGGSAGTGAISNVVTVTNSAGITASGDQSGGIVAQSIGGSGGTGGNAVAGAVAYADFDSSKSMSASVTLSGRGGSAGYANTTTVNLNNPSSGNYTISTNGLLANAVLAQSIGGGGGNAGSSFSGSSAGGISASVNIASDGGTGGRAGAVVVNTASQVILSTLLDQSSGIVAQSIGGSGGNGGLAAGAAISNSKSATVSIGGSGSSGGSANTVNVANSAIINTQGMLSLGVIAQSIGGSGGNGGSSFGGALAQDGAVAVTLGGGSGSGGTANKVTVNNYNAITTAKSQSTGILAQSIGGVGGNGGISASGGLSVSNTVSLAIGGAGGNGGTGGGVEVNSLNGGVINVAGNQSLGLVAQSIGGSGGNGGSVIDAGAALNFITGRSVTVSVGDIGGAGGTASGVSVQSYQNITTNGLNGIGILGQSIGGAGGNGVNSMSFGFDNVPGTGIDSTLLTVGGSGAHDGTSQSVAINQTGVISTANPNRSTTGITNDQAAGIVAQSIGGNGGNGGNARTNVTGSKGSVSLSIGGQGAYGANSNGVVSVYSNQNQTTGSITTDGMIAPTILAQSIGGGGGNGGWTQSNTTSNQYGVGFSLGGWGGNGGNANQANVYSGGTLTTTGQQSSAIIVQSIGGGGGNGGVATTQVSTSPGSATNGLTSVVGAQITGLTGVGSQAATYLAYDLVQNNASSSGNTNSTPKPTTSNSAPDSGVSASMAVGGFGGNAGLGNAVTVSSSSIINTSGAQANGITAQSIGGGGGIGGSSTSGADGGKYSAALSVGGFGGSSASSSTVAATNSGSIKTTGDLAMGIFVQSVGGGGGSVSSSSASSTTNAGGAAGVSLILGSWRDFGGSSGTGSAASMQAIGVTNTGTILTQGINSSGIFAQSVGGGGGHGGSSSTSSSVAATTTSSGSSSAGTGGSSTPTTSNTANSSVAGNTASGQYSSQAGSNKGTAVGLTVGGYGGSGGFANNVSVTNSGNIQTGYASTTALSSQRLTLGLSDNSAAIFAQSVGGGGGSGGSATSNADGSKTSVSLALGAYAGTSGDAGTVTVNNTGSLQTNGNNSSSIFAQSVGGGGGNGVSSTSTNGTGGSNAVAFGLGGSGANAGFGSAVTVNSSQAGSLIKTSGALSHGIFAQSVGGGGGNASAVNASATTTTSSISDNGTSNSSTAGAGTTSSLAKSGVSVAAGLGGSGGSGGDAGVVAVTNVSQITTSGVGSYGMFAQSVGGGGGNAGSSTTEPNSGTFSASFALGMSGSGSGNQVTTSSSNSVSTAGDNAVGIFAQSVGGGGGNAGSYSFTDSSNSGNNSVSMVLGGAGGASGNGNTVTVSNTDTSKTLQTSGKNAIAILAQSVGGGGGSATSVIRANSQSSERATFQLGGGGAGGASGNGGAVNLTNAAKVVTSGDNAVGIFGQSVGGGGGIGIVAQTTVYDQNITADFSLGGGRKAGSTANGVNGDGGAVSITNTNSVTTSGYNSIGVFGQSIGGGGGYVAETLSGGSFILNNSYLGGNNGATGNGGAVNITQNGSVKTTGTGSVGIVAQSVGGGGGYVSFMSKCTGCDITTGSNLAIGANPSGSSNGNGGAVTVTNNYSISVAGVNAIGILAQSVGGGGGVFVTSVLNNFTPTYNAGRGYGGAVTVNVNAPISVSGKDARGVLAQSVGGGGGYAASGNYVKDGGGQGTGNGGVVTVNLNASISTSGAGAVAVYAKTVSGSADPFITIAPGSVVSASGGGTAIVMDGANNQLVNYGSILVGDAIADKAVEIISPGVNDFQNHGTIAGRINNAAAANVSFINHEGARFTSVGGLDFLGTGTFTNKGAFIIGSGSENTASVQSFVGTFNQTSAGILGVNLDHNAGLADLLKLEGSGTINLAGKAYAHFLNAHLIKPGTTSQTEIIRADRLGSLILQDGFTIDRTAIMDMNLVKSPTSIQLVSTANFTPAGLSSFASQVGSAIGAYQTDGSNKFFQAATAQLVNLPTVSDLELAYTKLTGAASAIQAMPQANYQAVTHAVGTVSDRMNSWRIGDNLIATTKNPLAMMTGFVSFNSTVAQQTATDALPVGGQNRPSDQSYSNNARTWATPFAGTSDSNNLDYSVYGQSLGVEKESSNRKFIGGAALTVSQSNYTYSSSNIASIPGSATNYGASFYFGARHESAYLTAIGYLGGSTGSFTRQLQVMDFNTSTRVNVDSNILSARVEAGYNLLPNPEGKRALQVTPFVAISPTQIRQNGAYEYSDDLGAGLYYASNRNTAVPVSLGAEISGDMQLGDKEVLRSFLRVAWVHDLKSSGNMAAAYNPGNGITLYSNGSPSMGDMVVIKGGAKYNLGDRISAFATVDLELGTDADSFRGIAGSLGAMYSW
jgi:hypothetical protein